MVTSVPVWACLPVLSATRCGAEMITGRSLADLAVSGDDVLGRGQLREAERATGVQLLRGDAEFRAEAELAAVGEPGGRVHHDRGAVDRGDEAAGRLLRAGDDRL